MADKSLKVEATQSACVCITSCLDGLSARNYGEALQRNTVITELTIYESLVKLPEDDDKIEPLLDFIKSSKTLKTFEAVYAIQDARFFGKLITALSRNSSIEAVTFGHSISLTQIADFVMASKSVVNLSWKTTSRWNVEEDGSLRLKLQAAFRRNKTLKKLKTTHSLLSTPHIIHAISASTSIEEIEFFSCRFTVESLTQLIMDAKAVKKITLNRCCEQVPDDSNETDIVEAFRNNTCLSEITLIGFHHPIWFRLLARGIIRNRSLDSLLLMTSYLVDETYYQLLLDVVKYSSIRALSFGGYDNPFNRTLSSVISDFMSTDRKHLKEIRVKSAMFEGETYSAFGNILASLKGEKTFEVLHFDIHNRGCFHKCILHLPKLRGLDTLKLTLFELTPDDLDRLITTI